MNFLLNGMFRNRPGPHLGGPLGDTWPVQVQQQFVATTGEGFYAKGGAHLVGN